jgi:hypothetical protein
MEPSASPQNKNNKRNREDVVKSCKDVVKSCKDVVKSCKDDRLGRIRQGIVDTGGWESKQAIDFLSASIYHEFVHSDEISTTKLKTFLKMEYKMEDDRRAEKMAQTVVDSLLEGKGASNRKRQAMGSVRTAVQDEASAPSMTSFCPEKFFYLGPLCFCLEKLQSTICPTCIAHEMTHQKQKREL